MQSFELIDYIFIVVLILSTLFGFARGFIKELFTIANIAIAGFATYFLYPHSYKFFGNYVTDENVIKICSLFLVFPAMWILIIIANSYLIDALGKGSGGFFNRLLGTAFGLLRGSLLIASFYIMLVIATGAHGGSDENLPDWIKNAKTHNFVRMQSEAFLEILPKPIQEAYDNGGKGMFDNAVAALEREGAITEEEKNLIKYGLGMDDIETLKRIIKDMPVGMKPDLAFPDIATLEKVDFTVYVDTMIQDYNTAITDGRVEPKIPRRKIESLKRAFKQIESTNDDINKGIY